MRLTLRTLLAWLDDTLPPAEVRDIGRQVAESPYAQELVERIHRVTRQRRLTVPGKAGPDGTDPNVVAGYVDNDLEPDQVAEYEKKCLSSDVNLAEAASVHQILSLLGQKVHVPGEAKARMYQLVKGREAIPAPRTDGVKPPPAPVTRPIQPWVAPEPPRSNLLERFGPAAACVGLIALLSWSAYESLTPPPPPALSPVAMPGIAVPQPGSAIPGPAPVPLAQDGGPKFEMPATTSPTPPAGPAGAEVGTKEASGGSAADRTPLAAGPDTARTADPTTKPLPKQETAETPGSRVIPAGAVGIVDKSDGVLLRFSAEKREWERIAEGTSLASSDRLLCLAPFRARIAVGKAPLTLVGETQIRILSKNQAEAPALELQGGRILVDGSSPVGPLKVEFAGNGVTIDQQTAGSWAVERPVSWQYGQPATQPPPLAIHEADGELTVAMDRGKETLHGPGTILADPAGKLQLKPEKTVPSWVSESAPTLKDQKLGEQFLKQFSKDRPVLSDIVVATEDESPVTKKLAIFAVKALGDLSLLTPILSRAGDPDARQSTAAALRECLAQGPQAVKALREQLNEEFEVEDAVLLPYLSREHDRGG